VSLENTEQLASLDTEQIRPELSHLDEFSIDDLVSLMVRDVQKAPAALLRAEASLTEAIRAIVERMRRGGRLIYVGAGTAGRLGMLDAAEAGPTFNVDDGQVTGILAGGLSAFGVPIENAEDDFDGGAQAVEAVSLSELDCLVGISASGRTPYVLGALRFARAQGALTVGISCNGDAPLSRAVDYPIDVVVGPEIIAGSTRMNAGTAQKLVLNVISTATMIELGKTYGNLMVDVRPTNEKLRDRALRIVMEVTQASADEARHALEDCEWRTKVACVMIVGALNAHDALFALESHEGRLRVALDHVRPSTQPKHTGAWQRLGVAAALVNGEFVPGDVAIDGDEIVAVGLSGRGSGIALAGFVDVQVNGYAGVDLLNADTDAIIAMGEALLNDGVIAYQPTLISSDVDQLKNAARRLREARGAQRGARILGLHLEGPFLSEQRAGTHPVAHLKAPSAELLDHLLQDGDVAMMTLAPELPGALELITACVKRGIVVSLGHSAANELEASKGFDAGATSVTHLFNAMEPMSARSPGLAGVALTRRDVTVQLIGDGVHVADELLLLAFRAAPQRCVLVTDAIAGAASEKTRVTLGDVTVTVRDGVALRDNGTIAGSIGKLRDGLVRVGALGIDPFNALRAVSTRPATLAGVTDLSNVQVGRQANLLVVDDELRITRQWRSGKMVQSA
jgi:N-acetylmuramic acid 6-phosphate etherase/N-acetylglucosamine-6-phosphate deacetylase